MFHRTAGASLFMCLGVHNGSLVIILFFIKIAVVRET